jgi:small-conductance mechanosensitive channel
MIKNYRLVCSIISILFLNNSYGMFLEKLKEQQKPDVISVVKTQQQQLQEKLQQTKTEELKLNDDQTKVLLDLQGVLSSINEQLTRTRQQRLKAKDLDIPFYDRKLGLLQEIQQTIFTIQLMYKQIATLLQQHIQLLEEVLKDPTFQTYISESHAFYNVQDLQRVMGKISDQDVLVASLKIQRSDISSEVANKKKKFETMLQLYKEKKQEQDEFSGKPIALDAQFDFKQQGELLDLDEKLLGYERDLAQLRLQEIKAKNAFLETSYLIESEKLSVIKSNFARVKQSLRVEAEDVQQGRESIEKKKQESLTKRNNLVDVINTLTLQNDKAKERYDFAIDHFSISPAEVEEYNDWGYVAHTPDEYRILCIIADRKTVSFLLSRRMELKQAEIDLDEIELRRAENEIDILTSWYKITRRHYKDNEEINLEIKRYKDYVAQSNRDITLFKDKRTKATELLTKQNKSLTNLRLRLEQLKKDRNKFIEDFMLYNQCGAIMHKNEQLISEQIEATTKLMELYTHGITILEVAKKEAEGIVAELETKSIWQRSEYAISWNGIKNIFPDIEHFFQDVKTLALSFFARLDIKMISSWVIAMYHSPSQLLHSLFYLLLLVLFFWFVDRYAVRIAHQLLTLQFDHSNVVRVSRFCGLLLRFLSEHKSSFFIWLTLFIPIFFNVISDVFLHILFYLGSIPYIIYLAFQFNRTIITYNTEHNQVLFNATLQRRFAFVFSSLCYVTIFVFFFREAFVLATISKSELPTILFAIYSIVLRALIIFSIGKEEILSILPKRGAFWDLFSQIIKTYYYPFLLLIIVLMVLSDPYIGGYSNLVSYMFWGSIGSMLLVWMLYIMHDYIKDAFSIIFIQAEDDLYRERFANAKTWYGLFVILLFMAFVFVGLLLGARIWNLDFNVSTLLELWHAKLFSTGYDQDLGQTIWFTPKKFSYTVLAILGGAFVAFTLNRYVFRRIFELIPVSIGIQDTVQTITRYLILAFAVFLGFQWAGIEGLLVYIGVILASIGWMAKEPLSDFVSYFVILVQRPIQIGDFIMINDELQGVVRQITPRSVLLRRKNSYTIIVPNSMLITHPINNWNYARNFIAFDDIFFTVPYTADPLKVKQVIAKVFEDSTTVLKNPAPIIRLDNFSQDGFVFKVRGFLTEKYVLDQWDIASDIRFAIVRSLREQGIKIAVPTRIIMNTTMQPQ